MKVVKGNIGFLHDIEPVVQQWRETCNGESMGFDLDVSKYLNHLTEMMFDSDSDLFLLIEDEKVVGYMGVEWFVSPVGKNKIANEHYWYILKGHRGKQGAMLLFNEVKDWAKEYGCSHLMMNASTLASDLHDKVCNFYKKLGMKKMETSYIQEIK